MVRHTILCLHALVGIDVKLKTKHYHGKPGIPEKCPFHLRAPIFKRTFFLEHPDNGDTSDFDYNVGDDRKLQRIIKCLTVQWLLIE